MTRDARREWVRRERAADGAGRAGGYVCAEGAVPIFPYQYSLSTSTHQRRKEEEMGYWDEEDGMDGWRMGRTS